MHHFVTEMCTCVHISLQNDALWDMCIVGFVRLVYTCPVWVSYGQSIARTFGDKGLSYPEKFPVKTNSYIHYGPFVMVRTKHH